MCVLAKFIGYDPLNNLIPCYSSVVWCAEARKNEVRSQERDGDVTDEVCSRIRQADKAKE